MVARGLALGLCLAAAARALPAQGPDAIREAELRARRAAERIEALQREADRLAAEARGVLVELRQLEIERAIRAEAVVAADARLAVATAALEAAQARAEDLAAQRVAETPAIEARLVEIYKRGRGGYVRLLLGAEHVRDWGRMSRGVAAMARLDRLRVEAHRRRLAAERAAVAELAARRDEAAALQQQAAEAARALARAVAARNRRLEEIDRRRELAAQYVEELDAARRAVEETLAALAAGAPAAVPALPLAPFRGELDWPVRGPIAARFGRASSSRLGTAVARNGIEVSAAEGTPVRAVHDGAVAFAEPFSGYGTLVIVDHGGEAYSLYGHLATAVVARGEAIGRGAILGVSGVGPAGQATVYFELRIDGRPVDPLQWLRSHP